MSIPIIAPSCTFGALGVGLGVVGLVVFCLVATCGLSEPFQIKCILSEFIKKKTLEKSDLNILLSSPFSNWDWDHFHNVGDFPPIFYTPVCPPP